MLKRGLWVLLFVACLSACDSTRQISTDGMHAYELSVATNSNQLAVAWYGGTQQPDAIYFQWLTTQGKPNGPPQRITDGQRNAYEVDLQFIDNDALLVWYEKDVHNRELTAWIERLRRNGEVLWRHSLNGQDGQARNPVVRVANQIIHVAWIETSRQPALSDHPAIWSTTFDATGNAITMPQRVGEASIKTWNLNAAVDRRGVFYVVYDAQLHTRAKELQLLMIDDQYVRHLPLSRDDGYSSSYPDLAISNEGGVALTWFDNRDGNNEVYLSTGSLSELQVGGPLHIQRITHTPADSIGAYLAWNDERLALVWCDAQEGQQELYGQLFNARGGRLTEIQRLTSTANQSSIPAIRAWRKSFVVTWNEYQREGAGAHGNMTMSAAMLRFMT